MKKIFEEIKKIAGPMQDLREDEGHAEKVASFAIELCKLFKANENIVIPAATLHDIGYYGMEKSLLKNLMAGKLSEEETKQIKDKHMEKGAILAKQILEKVRYNPEMIKVIVKIIENHDLGGECSSVEEKIIRDADKLWRFSKPGFDIDVKRRGCPPIEWHNYLSKNIEKPNYFYTEEAKTIARDELEKRKNESKV